MTTLSGEGLRVILLRDRDDMGAAIAASLEALGCRTTIHFRHRLHVGQQFGRDDADVVLAYGPHNGSILEAADTVDIRSPRRPLFVWWLLENLPASSLSPTVIRWAAKGRLLLDQCLRIGTGKPIAATKDRWRRVLEAGHRVRIWGEARQLSRQGRLDGFYVDSAVAARILARDGVQAVHLPFGGHEVFGRNLGLERDRDVVFIGQPGSRRRLRLLEQTKSALAHHGITVSVIDGSQGYLDGNAREQLLNRTRIVLNIMKEPEDSVGLRFLFAGANGALTVSEPTPALTFLKAGEHYVEAPVEDLADAVRHYLLDNEARERMTAHTCAFLAGPGHLDNMVGRIVADCQRLRSMRPPPGSPGLAQVTDRPICR